MVNLNEILQLGTGPVNFFDKIFSKMVSKSNEQNANKIGAFL